MRRLIVMGLVVVSLMAMAAVAGAEPRGGIDPIRPTTMTRMVGW